MSCAPNHGLDSDIAESTLQLSPGVRCSVPLTVAALNAILSLARCGQFGLLILVRVAVAGCVDLGGMVKAQLSRRVGGFRVLGLGGQGPRVVS